MPNKRPGRNGGTLMCQAPGEPSRNPYGRPKKFISTLKDHGYKLCEVHDTMQVLLALKKDELYKISEKADATVLERIVARALHGACKKGDLSVIETLLTRVYGKPAESKLTGQKEDDYSNLTPEQFARRFEKALAQPRGDIATSHGGEAGSESAAGSTGNPESKA